MWFCHNPYHVRDATAAIDTALQWLEQGHQHGAAGTRSPARTV